MRTQLSPKERAQQLPTFQAMSIEAKRSPISATAVMFSVHFRATQSVTAAYVRLPLQIYLYSGASAAAVVQSQLHEPCSLYYFVSLYTRQSFHEVLCPPCIARSWRRHSLAALSIRRLRNICKSDNCIALIIASGICHRTVFPADYNRLNVIKSLQ